MVHVGLLGKVAPITSDRAQFGRFDGTPASIREVRRWLGEALPRLGLEDRLCDATLCASELASNVVLHAGCPYTVVVTPTRLGARVEVVDDRPEVVPMAVPTTGTATPLTSRGTTGRGLQLVAALSNCWGYTTSAQSKIVWFEVDGTAPSKPTTPVVVEGYRDVPDSSAPVFHLGSLPVWAAVASGIHVEELVRDVRLVNASAPPESIERLNTLLRVSAPARLLGRHAAFRAAARNETRFDIDVRLSEEVVAGFAALNQMLTDTSHRLGITVSPLAPDVIAFRQWLVEEIMRQVVGERPSDCPLPD
jgi:anti-sigma regulatory factor (Ser/Thr protein kinase)